MANEVWSVFGRLVLDDDDYNRDLQRDERTTEKTSKKMSKAFKGIGTGIKVMSGALIGAGAAIGGLVLNANEAVSEIEKFSQITGTTTDEFQQWDSVMKRTGFSMEAASGDFAALAEKAVEATTGAGEASEIFEKLGVSVTDTSGKMKTQGQIFEETIEGLQNMEDVTERNAIASALLGTTGEELVPVLNMTNEELSKMRENANVIDEDQLAKAKEFKEGYDQIRATLNNVVVELGIKFMPLLTKLFEWIQGNMPTIKRTFEVVFGAMSTALTFVGDIITNFVSPALKVMFDFIQSNWPTIQAVGEEVFGSLAMVATGLWEVFRDGLLPILVALWDFISPTFPLIAAVVKAQFEIVIAAVDGVITVFKTMLGWVNDAIDALKNFTFAKNKADTSFEAGGLTFESSESGFLGGSFSRAARANGGRVTAGNAFNVGERGVETFIPDTDGVIIPNGGFGKTEVSKNEITNNFNVSQLVVREEADIQRVARELFNMQRMEARGVGV